MSLYINGAEVSGTYTGTGGAYATTNGITAMGISDHAAGDPQYTLAKLDDVKIYNYARTPSQIAWDYNRGGPVGWWKFDECSGSTAHDSSGFANHGTIISGSGTIGSCTGSTGEIWYDGATGKINSSLDFNDAESEYVSISDTDVYTFGNSSVDQPFSISAWVKQYDANAYFIFSKGSAGAGEYYLEAFSNDIYFNLYDNTATNYITMNTNNTNPLITGEWNHIIATYDGRGGNNAAGGINVYVNGILSEKTSTLIGSYTAMHNQIAGSTIGRFWTNGLSYSNGQIDEVKVFAYELTPEQVRNEYNNGALRFSE
jgi:hypothetical protein